MEYWSFRAAVDMLHSSNVSHHTEWIRNSGSCIFLLTCKLLKMFCSFQLRSFNIMGQCEKALFPLLDIHTFYCGKPGCSANLWGEGPFWWKYCCCSLEELWYRRAKWENSVSQSMQFRLGQRSSCVLKWRMNKIPVYHRFSRQLMFVCESLH